MMAKHFLVQAETQLNDGDSSAMLSNNRKVTYTDGKKSVRPYSQSARQCA